MLANTQQTIAIIVALVVVAGWVLYLLANARRAKPEVGSELELAPNRKPYLNDDQLEGPKLERALTWSLAGLAISAVGLPLYWLGEPGRQEGAIGNFEETFADRGADLFATTEAGGFNCAGCHGGMEATGGVAAYTLTQPVIDEATGQPVIDEATGEPETELLQVQWKAPALNNVLLRYSEDEVLFVLRYGRPFSPMPAWGIEGGGPMNEQQLENLVDYLWSIQLTPEEAQAEASEALAQALELGDYESVGEAVFNLEYAGGAYGCARCHTQGWSWGDPAAPGAGAFGPSLYGVRDTFPVVADHVEFIVTSAEEGDAYGVQGQMDGGAQMPAFGQMLTEEMIVAVVDYERQLELEGAPASPDVLIDEDNPPEEQAEAQPEEIDPTGANTAAGDAGAAGGDPGTAGTGTGGGTGTGADTATEDEEDGA